MAIICSIGYRNVLGPDGKRTIEPDPEVASIVTSLFDRFARGNLSIKTLAAEMRTDAPTVRGRKLYSSLVHNILRKRIYTGDFDFDGVTVPWDPCGPREPRDLGAGPAPP